MLRLYGPKAAERIVERCAPTIEAVSTRYALPAAFIRALLYTELVRIDVLDLAADLLVRLNRCRPGGLFGKRDSSTGCGQIFGFVAINAANFAVDRGLTSYAALGLPERRLDPENPADLFLMWDRLNRDPAFNIELSALNLLAAADEVTGRTDYSAFTPEEIRRVYTRYNGTSKQITPYGEEAYGHYLRYAAHSDT